MSLRRGGSRCSPATPRGTMGVTGLVVQCWLLISSSLAAAQTVYSSANINYGGVGINGAGEISRPGPATANSNSNTPATNSDKKYLLYRVPPFEASLTFPDPGFQNHRGQTALMDIDESLDAITSRYLFDFVFRYMEGLSRQHRRPLAQRLHSLEVRADLYEVDGKGNILVGPNIDGRQRRERRLLRSVSMGSGGDDLNERRTSSFIPGANPANNDQYANLPPKYIVAEFTGTASFEDYRYDPNDFNVAMGEGTNSEDDVVIDIDEATLRLMIGKALLQTNAYLQELRTATDHLVASVTAANLRMDLDLALADKVVSSGGAGSSGSDFYYGAPPKTEPSLQSGGAQPASGAALGSTSLPTPATDEGLSNKEISTIAVMAFFLVGFVGFIFMYMKREYHHGHGHSGPSRIRRSDEDSEDPYSPAALRRNKNGFLEFHDEWGSDSVGEEEGVYPVGVGTPPVSSRRYVNPDNGQVMYGASYTPPETEQVRAHYAAQQRNQSKKKPKRNLTLISPMMTVVEEEPPPLPPSRFSELPRSRNGHQLGSTNDSQMYANQQGFGLLSSLPPALNIVQNVSSFFESVTGGPSPNAGRQSITSPTGVESFIPPVPYKDFPRNDGTPCVIFSDTEESSNGWELSTELRERQALTAMSVEVGMSGVRETGNRNSAHNQIEEDEPIITEEGIVDFVGKLEHLMTLKTRQYAERVKMAQERAERAERRRRERTASTKSVSPSKRPGRANPQAASVGSPPSSKHGTVKERSQFVPEGTEIMNTVHL